MHISIPVEEAVRFINVTEISPLVSHCQIKVLYIGENRNGTIISREVAEKMGKYLPASPIVGRYIDETRDFGGHDKEVQVNEEDGTFSVVDLTRPYGFVDTNAKVWFQQFQDDDGVIRDYLLTEGYIWTGAYPESKRIINKGNNQSMELTKVQGNWTGNINSDDRFFIINEALIEKLCILGENTEPCFEGAQIKKEFSLNEEFAQLKEIMTFMLKDVTEILNKGGSEQMEEVKVEESVVTEEFEKNSDNSEISNTEENQETVEEKKYNLEDVVEYTELNEAFKALQEKYNTLEADYTALQAAQSEFEALKQFKFNVEKAQKEDMINKEFYMLSDEDKKDVIEHIDEYSLDEIEAKLSVICVRNKVSFNLEEDKSTETLNFSLNEAANTVDDAPAWVKAVRQTSQNM